jgi:aminopeptidase N
VLQLLLVFTERLLAVTADPAWVPVGKDLLAGRALELLRAAEPGSDHQLAWAQLLAWSATSASQLDLLAELLAGTTEIAGLAIDTELRWQLLNRLVTTGRAGDAEIDAELERDNTDAGRRHGLASRAAVPDAAHKAEAWHQLADSADLGFEAAAELAASFGQPEHAGLLAPYARRYLAQLPEIWAARSELVRMLFAGVLFPYFAASPELLVQVDEFLAEPGRDPAISRIVIEGRDGVEKALRSRALEDAARPRGPSSD